MTEVYQSISTTNEVEDRYAKNDAARRALFGPLSLVIKCIGFDDTYSLFKKETRGRCISWIATPLAIIGLLLLLHNFAINLNEIRNTLSFHWGELFILTFLAIQSFFSALFVFFFTRSLFFLRFYESWAECAKLAEIYNKEKEEKEDNGVKKSNGDAENGGDAWLSPRFARSHCVWSILAFLFFISASITTSVKYALYNGHLSHANESATEPLLDNVYTLEPLTSVWAAIVTATALSCYGIMHGIMIDTIDYFNNDLLSASSSSSLSSQLDVFSIRYQSILAFVRFFSKGMGHFATGMTKSATVVNLSAMFLSLAFKSEIEGLANICTLLWTFIAVGPMVVILLQPAKVQAKLNKTSEILVADKNIWNGDMVVAQKAQMMLTKRNYTDTTISIFNCLKLTPWVANGVMLVAPIIGGSLTILKIFTSK